MAFETRSPPAKRPRPGSLTPATPFSGTQSNEPWFFSSCSVNDITEITLCRDISLCHKPIIGMQVLYSSGHKACVGQFRFDRTFERITVEEGCKGLHIGQMTKDRFLYVADVMVYPPCNPSKLCWVYMHWGGDLEWWFSSRQCFVRYACPEE